jgi:DNA-binding response OmpR family regulator
MPLKATPGLRPCIVVVEDESLIRMLAVETLLDAGFTVLEAEHAAAGLSHLEAQASRIAVLFTDINMPGDMNGLELAHHARTLWPWIAQLITSGRGTPALNTFPAGSRFVLKPYEIDNVVAHVRALMAG